MMETDHRIFVEQVSHSQDIRVLKNGMSVTELSGDAGYPVMVVSAFLYTSISCSLRALTFFKKIM